MEYALRKAKLGATVMMTHYDKQYEIECIRNLYNMGVKGIVLCSVNNGTEFENYLKKQCIKTTFNGSELETFSWYKKVLGLI